MLIRCHQCGDTLSPELPSFEFRAVAVCDACARRNLERHRAGLGKGDTFETGPDAHPFVTDIDGKEYVVLDTSPDGLADLRERAKAFLNERFDEFRGQLPVIRDAYLSMRPKARRQFRKYVEALAKAVQWENEGFKNPFAIFQAYLRFTPLAPASSQSVFAGQYVGREERDVFWVRALPVALDAWDSGREFAPASVEELKPYE